MSSQDEAYEPQDAIAQTIPATLLAGGAGLLASAVQNTLTKQNVGAMGVFTRTGSSIAIFGGAVAAYQFTCTASANLREKKDFINEAIGGFFGGAVVGLRARSMPTILGYAATFAVTMGAFNYTGGLLSGYQTHSAVPEYQRREELNKRQRRPIEETINEIGEGRGIYGPGYEDRRKERVKAAYGIEPPTPWYKASA